MNRIRLRMIASETLLEEVRTLLPEASYEIALAEPTQPDYPDVLLVGTGMPPTLQDADEMIRASQALGVPVIYVLEANEQPSVQQTSVITPFWYVFKPLRQPELMSIIEMARQQPAAGKQKIRKSRTEKVPVVAYAGFGKPAAESTFYKFARHAPEFICIISTSPFSIEYTNAHAGLGYDLDKIFAQPRYLTKLIHPQDLPSAAQAARQFRQAGAPESGQQIFRIQRKDGQWEWISGRWIVLKRNTDEVPQQLLLSFAAVTELYKTKAAYETIQNNWQAMIENTHDGIWVLSRNYRIVAMNSSFAYHYKLIYGFDLQVGDLILEKASNDVVAHWKSLYERAFGGERFAEEISYEDKDRQKTFYYEVSFNPIFSEAGKVEGASMFARNITRQKKAGKELLQANLELDSFVYRASHDLRAPLRSVLGLVALARMEQDTAQRNNYLNLIEKSARKLDNFIVDLTNISRNKRAELAVNAVNFEQIIEECAENLRYMANADRVTLKKNLHLQADFHSDASRIAIIFQNIISNAVKYQNLQLADAFLCIDITADEQRAVVTFTDNGQGIPEESLDRIFDMFFRASDHAYGSGLGLYITRQVAERLNGTIHVRSSLGRETVFTLTLPNLAAGK